MSENKSIDPKLEVKDEELDEISGGIRPKQEKQEETKPCTRCQKPIPVDKIPGYCDECLAELNRQGVHPFV